MTPLALACTFSPKRPVGNVHTVRQRVALTQVSTPCGLDLAALQEVLHRQRREPLDHRALHSQEHAADNQNLLLQVPRLTDTAQAEPVSFLSLVVQGAATAVGARIRNQDRIHRME